MDLDRVRHVVAERAREDQRRPSRGGSRARRPAGPARRRRAPRARSRRCSARAPPRSDPGTAARRCPRSGRRRTAAARRRCPAGRRSRGSARVARRSRSSPPSQSPAASTHSSENGSRSWQSSAARARPAHERGAELGVVDVGTGPAQQVTVKDEDAHERSRLRAAPPGPLLRSPPMSEGQLYRLRAPSTGRELLLAAEPGQGLHGPGHGRRARGGREGAPAATVEVKPAMGRGDASLLQLVRSARPEGSERLPHVRPPHGRTAPLRGGRRMRLAPRFAAAITLLALSPPVAAE